MNEVVNESKETPPIAIMAGKVKQDKFDYL